MLFKLRLLSAVRAGTLGLMLLAAGCGDGSEHDDSDDTWEPPEDDDATDDAGTHTDASGRFDSGARDGKADDDRDTGVGEGSDTGPGPVEDAGADTTDASIDSGTDASSGSDTDASADASSDAGIDAAADARADSATDATIDSATDARADSATDARTDAASDPVSECLQGAAGRGEDTSDPCVVCGCNSCASELSACFGATDVAAGGPAAGTSRGVLCAAVVECGRESGCTGQECYCGTASTISCGLFNGANGPCKSQIEAAAETTSATTIQQRQSNTSFAIGRANAVSSCSVDHCSTQCGL